MKNKNCVDGPVVLNKSISLSSQWQDRNVKKNNARDMRTLLDIRFSNIDLFPFFAFDFQGYWGSLGKGFIGSLY